MVQIVRCTQVCNTAATLKSQPMLPDSYLISAMWSKNQFVQLFCFVYTKF